MKLKRLDEFSLFAKFVSLAWFWYCTSALLLQVNREGACGDCHNSARDTHTQSFFHLHSSIFLLTFWFECCLEGSFSQSTVVLFVCLIRGKRTFFWILENHGHTHIEILVFEWWNQLWQWFFLFLRKKKKRACWALYFGTEGVFLSTLGFLDPPGPPP